MGEDGRSTAGQVWQGWARMGREGNGTAGNARVTLFSTHKLTHEEINMNTIENELRRIMQVNGGLLDPADVVITARDPASALHRCFTWDDGDAAAQWRLEEARKLIRSVTVIIPGAEPLEIRAFVSLPADRPHGGGYRDVAEVGTSELMREQFMAELHASAQRFENIARVFGVAFNGDALRAVARRIGKKKP